MWAKLCLLNQKEKFQILSISFQSMDGPQFDYFENISKLETNLHAIALVTQNMEIEEKEEL